MSSRAEEESEKKFSRVRFLSLGSAGLMERPGGGGEESVGLRGERGEVRGESGRGARIRLIRLRRDKQPKVQCRTGGRK